MKGDTKKQQIVILCCLMAVLALVTYRMVGMSTSANTPAPKPQVTTDDSKVPPGDSKDESKTTCAVGTSSDPDGSDKTKPVAVAANSESAPPVKPRDPFAPQIAPKTTVGSGTGSSMRSPLPLMSQSNVPPLPIISPLSNEPVRVNVPGGQTEDSMPEFKLTGIIEGVVNVAIIRGPDNARYIVREGQVIDGRYRVASVSRSGVCIKYNGRSVILRLGTKESA